MTYRGKDLTGQSFGKWFVIGLSKQKDKGGRVLWDCRCECGYRQKVRTGPLMYGKSKSCLGCVEHGKHKITHGLRKSRAYKTHESMIARCCNPKHKSYPRYGGRGISVCDRWRESLLNFVEDMGHPPEGMSLDRVDNDGDYCPENCRWSTWKEQANNRSSSVQITIFGLTMTIAEWSDHPFCKVKQDTLGCRIRSGWPPALAVLCPRKTYLTTFYKRCSVDVVA